MTDLSAEQNAMLDQWARRYGFEPYLGDHEDCRCGQCNEYHLVVTALRELLLAVQERDAAMCEHFLGDLTAEEWPPCGLIQAKGRWDSGVSEKTATNISRAIRAQTYADLFLKEE